MQARGVEVDHATSNRPVLERTAALDERVRSHWNSTNDSIALWAWLR
jgi:transposase-like protein